MNRLALFVAGSVLLVGGCGEGRKPTTVQQEPVAVRVTQDERQRNVEQDILITFDKTQYTFTIEEVAKRIAFNYTVTVTSDVHGVIPRVQNTGGVTYTEPTGLYPFEEVSGNGQSYSLWDIGLGPGGPREPRTIKKGKHVMTFNWDGRNWKGPSDFGAPKGKPFPPGTYEVKVTVVGERVIPEGREPYKVEGAATVVLTP